MAEDTCGCCSSDEQMTPVDTANRPGLDALAYRVGTHATFLATMKARLAGMALPADDGAEDNASHPLDRLTTRAANDPAIAVLDAWATVADVLTFYQERIANEGYLRTATERRSVLELARLVGYAPRPGVAATVFLAYTIDDNHKGPAFIDEGATAQSVPGPGEAAQTFETSDRLEAWAGWNLLGHRLTRPQTIEGILAKSQLYLDGIATNLKPNDPLLMNTSDQKLLVRVMEVEPDAAANRTRVAFQLWQATGNAAATPPPATVVPISGVIPSFTGGAAAGLVALASTGGPASGATSPATSTSLPPPPPAPDELLTVVNALEKPPSLPPADSSSLVRSVEEAFGAGSDTGMQVLSAFRPELRDALPVALASVQTPESDLAVFALRVKSSVYGSTAPPRPVTGDDGQPAGTEEWPVDGTATLALRLFFGSGDGPAPSAAEITFSVDGHQGAILVALKTDASVENTQTTPVKYSFGFGRTDSIQTATGMTITLSLAGGLKKQQDIVLFADHDGNYSISVTTDGDADFSSSPLSPGHTTRVVGKRHRTGVLLDTSFSTLRVGRLSLVVSTEVLLAPEKNVVALDAPYEQITPGSWVAIVRKNRNVPFVATVEKSATVAKNSYNFPAKVTELTLARPAGNWLTNDDLVLSDIRQTTVLALSEPLKLAEEPIEDPICKGGGATDDDWIELDGVYTYLKSGRRLIVAGERAGVKDALGNETTGVQAAELVMLSGVRHGVRKVLTGGQGDKGSILPGEHAHTSIRFSMDLAYCYKRDKVKIYGNVVKATHGATHNEIVGDANASLPFQAFALRQKPLTYVPAATPSGAQSTLRVYVNDLEWRLSPDLVGLAPTDRTFTTSTGGDDVTTFTFGDGKNGARPPTGQQNVRTVYRTGIGAGGNVRSGQITQLLARPLGVRDVINPIAASGGADREDRDQIRRNAPLVVTALDRLVSVQDYGDFTRTFAGITKASATRLSDGRRQLVHVTIAAGTDDTPISPTDDLYRNLVAALGNFGDIDLPVRVDHRQLLLLVISAQVYVSPRYLVQTVLDEVRSALLAAYGFSSRDLGQGVHLSDVMTVMQKVKGVAYVDVDMLGAIPETTIDASGGARPLTPAEITGTVLQQANYCAQPQQHVAANLARAIGGAILPAQLAILSPQVADTILLNGQILS